MTEVERGEAARGAKLFPIDAIEHGEGWLRVDARVPPDLACFAGHFPGQPVLPGFVQLHWVAELACARLAVRGPFSAIDALRFRSPLLPDDRFALRIDAGPPLRFAFRRGDEVVSEGRLAPSGDVSPHRPHAPPDGTARDATPLPLRIPQQPPMRLLSRVLSHAEGVTVCEAQVARTHPLVCDGRAPVWLALELLAQGMAAQGGLALGDAAPRRAFVVGARRIALRTRGFTEGEALWVSARHVRGESGLVVCDCALGTGRPPARGEPAPEDALAHGRMTAFVEPQPPSTGSATSSS